MKQRRETTVNVVVHTDNTLTGDELMLTGTASEVGTMLAQYDNRVVRVQVHLSRESSDTQNGIRCVMEAFIDGQSPAVASEFADTLDECVRGTAHQLERVIESQLGALRTTQNRP